MKLKQQSSAPTNKVLGAALGGGVAGAIVVVLVTLANYYNFEVSLEFQAALLVLLTTIGPLVVGYLTPPGAGDGQIVAQGEPNDR